MARVKLPVPGLHNVQNALAAIAAASLLAAASITAAPGGRPDMVAAAVGDVDAMRAAAERAAATLAGFKGVRRRFELVGEAGGCRVYDDYAHHPTEVRAVIQAAMQRCAHTAGRGGRALLFPPALPPTTAQTQDLTQPAPPAWPPAGTTVTLCGSSSSRTRCRGCRPSWGSSPSASRAPRASS